MRSCRAPQKFIVASALLGELDRVEQFVASLREESRSTWRAIGLVRQASQLPDFHQIQEQMNTLIQFYNMARDHQVLKLLERQQSDFQERVEASLTKQRMQIAAAVLQDEEAPPLSRRPHSYSAGGASSSKGHFRSLSQGALRADTALPINYVAANRSQEANYGVDHGGGALAPDTPPVPRPSFSSASFFEGPSTPSTTTPTHASTHTDVFTAKFRQREAERVEWDQCVVSVLGRLIDRSPCGCPGLIAVSRHEHGMGLFGRATARVGAFARTPQAAIGFGRGGSAIKQKQLQLHFFCAYEVHCQDLNIERLWSCSLPAVA